MRATAGPPLGRRGPNFPAAAKRSARVRAVGNYASLEFLRAFPRRPLRRARLICAFVDARWVCALPANSGGFAALGRGQAGASFAVPLRFRAPPPASCRARRSL